MTYIAVEGMTLEIATYTECKFDIKTDPSKHVIIDGAKVYSGSIAVQLISAQGGGDSFVSSAPFVLNPSAQYDKVDNKPVLLEGDQGQGQAVWKVGDSTITDNFTCTVKKAGQTSVQGE